MNYDMMEEDFENDSEVEDDDDEFSSIDIYTKIQNISKKLHCDRSEYCVEKLSYKEIQTIPLITDLIKGVHSLVINDYGWKIGNEDITKFLKLLYGVAHVHAHALSVYHIRGVDSPWNSKQLIFLLILKLRCLYSDVIWERDLTHEDVEFLRKNKLLCSLKLISTYSLLDVTEAIKILEVRWNSIPISDHIWNFLDILEMRMAYLMNVGEEFKYPNPVIDIDMIVMNNEKNLAAATDNLLSDWAESIFDFSKTRIANNALKRMQFITKKTPDYITTDKLVGFWAWIGQDILLNNFNEENLRKYLIANSLRPGEKNKFEKRQLGIKSNDVESILVQCRLRYESKTIFSEARNKLANGEETFEGGLIALAHFETLITTNLIQKSGWWLQNCVWREQKIIRISKTNLFLKIPIILILGGSHAVIWKKEIYICENVIHAIATWTWLVSSFSKHLGSFKRPRDVDIIEQEEESFEDMPSELRKGKGRKHEAKEVGKVRSVDDEMIRKIKTNPGCLKDLLNKWILEEDKRGNVVGFSFGYLD